MEKIRSFFPSEEKCPVISFQLGALAYLVCFIIGILTTLMSIYHLIFTVKPHYQSFNLWYTINNLVWFISTFILIGPKSHYIKIKSNQLFPNTVCLMSSIFLSFLFGFLTSSKLINIFFSIFQFGSIVVFTYSYFTLQIKKTQISNNDNVYENNNLFNELK